MSPAMIWNENLTLGGILLKSSTAPNPRTMADATNNHPNFISVRKWVGKWKNPI